MAPMCCSNLPCVLSSECIQFRKVLKLEPRVFLVRHAEPDRSRTDLVYHLPPGPPLSAAGVEEAQALGLFLRHAGIRRLLYSPLERCRQTARIAWQVINAGHDMLPGAEHEVELACRIEESQALLEWQPGENTGDVVRRVWPEFERAVDSSTDPLSGPVALVTHGGPIGALLGELGMSAQTLSEYRRRFDSSNPLPTAGVWSASRSVPLSPWQLDLVFGVEARRVI